MRRSFSGPIVVGLAALVAQTGCLPPSTSARSGIGLSVGDEPSEFVSHDLDGKEVRLSSLRGKVVMLDFWATWCPPCRAMIPHVKTLVERLKDKPFVMVGVSLDDRRQDAAEFVAQEKMPWTQWWNGPGGAAREWAGDGIPATYLLDARGVIRYQDVGFNEQHFAELEGAVNELLKEMDEKKP